MKFLIYAFLFYVLFRFITRFVLPVFQATRVVKQRMQDMQQQMEAMQQQQATANNSHSKQTRSVNEGDYIEYEEVK